MDRLPLAVLAHVFELLTATDVAQLTATCAALQPRERMVQDAIALVVKHRFGDVLASLREDDASWPRSVAVLRAAEVLTLKKWLASAAVQSYEDASCSAKPSVVVSRAWLLAWKKRCLAYEHFVQQFRPTKRKQRERQQQQQARSKAAQRARQVTTAATDSTLALAQLDAEAAATRDASALIVCPHDAMLPLALCVGRAKRAVVSRSVFSRLALYATDARGFALPAAVCEVCEAAEVAKTQAAEALQQSRFESQIAGSNDLLDLLLRKSGYPNELFSPASSRGHTHVSLSHLGGKSYFLVPKRWLVKWRSFVRCTANAYPGPVLNAELVCTAHQRNVVPPYITMFLSGFSIEQSLQASQALGTCASKQYEIVTAAEWEALHDRYCAEYAVGFAVHDGSYHWQTPECHVCYYGMGGSGTERRNASR